MAHKKDERISIPLRQRISMVSAWTKSKLGEQLKSVAFIAVYLVIFQVFILRAPVQDALSIFGGVLAVVVGLFLFTEGLFLGIMPLGEQCGLRLPARSKLAVLIAFSAILGLTATIAEPAIGLLKAQGSALLPWQAPVLYYMLNDGSGWTIGAIAVGVALAVVFGVLRFMRGWSLKPFLFIFFPVLFVLSFLASQNPKVASAVALAWDTGGITTGPVTVPLVIALGAGVSRMAGRANDSSSGLGVVTLASALPVAAVLALAFGLSFTLPGPSEASAFFAPENRELAQRTVASPTKLYEYAKEALDADSLNTLFPQASVEASVVEALPASGDAVAEHASETVPEATPQKQPSFWRGLFHRVAGSLWLQNLVNAIKSIVPLALVLVLTLILIVREKIPFPDEIGLGLVFCVFGLFLFSFGMDAGLVRLGTQSGANLPRAWLATERPDLAVLYENINEDELLKTRNSDGELRWYLPQTSRDGPVFTEIDEQRWDRKAGTYLHIPQDKPVASREWLGFLLVFIFVFAMGLGTTLAEPSLNALGAKLEDITTGTYKKSFLLTTVSIGVGFGLVIGFARILFDFPMVPVLAGAYVLALLLTVFSSEEVSGIAWDSAGVTTGPVTVPLVVTTGLALGGFAGSADAFGVLAFASVLPVIAVLLSGIVVELRRGRLAA